MDFLTEVSKLIYPGATHHPAFDSSWILTELQCALEEAADMRQKLEKISEILADPERPALAKIKSLLSGL